MPSDILLDKPELAQPQPLHESLTLTNLSAASHGTSSTPHHEPSNSSTLPAAYVETPPTSTTTYRTSHKRKRDEYEQSSGLPCEEDEAAIYRLPEPVIPFRASSLPPSERSFESRPQSETPFDTDTDFEHEEPTFEEWCARERHRERQMRNVTEIRELFKSQSKVVSALTTGTAPAAAAAALSSEATNNNDVDLGYTSPAACVANGIAFTSFLEWLSENHSRQVWDSIASNWGVNKSGQLFKLPDPTSSALQREEIEKNEGGVQDNFAVPFQIALEEHRIKRDIVELAENLLKEILALESGLPVFDSTGPAWCVDCVYNGAEKEEFNWIELIGLCRRVVKDKGSFLGDNGGTASSQSTSQRHHQHHHHHHQHHHHQHHHHHHQHHHHQQQQLDDLAAQCKSLDRLVWEQVRDLVYEQAEALEEYPVPVRAINLQEIGKVLEVLGLNGVQDFLKVEEMAEREDRKGISDFLMDRYRKMRWICDMAWDLRQAILDLDEVVGL